MRNRPQCSFSLSLTFIMLMGCTEAPMAQSEHSKPTSSPEESIETLMQQDKDKFLNMSFKNYLTKMGIPLSSPMQNEYESLQTGNLYSNHYFNLTIDLPNNWDTDRGVSEYTLVRAYQADSGITIHLNVQPLLDKFERKDGMNPNTIAHLNSLHNGDYLSAMKHLLKTQGGIDVEDMKLSETRVGVNQFVVTSYSHKQYFEEEPYYMKTATYQCIMYNTTYTISYSSPDFFFDPNLILSVLNRFKMLNPKLGHSKQ